MNNKDDIEIIKSGINGPETNVNGKINTKNFINIIFILYFEK